MGNTKEDILLTALELFARDGYEAVSVSQIAGALSMTKGALYRHYSSKRDIFLQIVRQMEQRDQEQAAGHGMPEGSVGEMPDKYDRTSWKCFVAYSKALFAYWTEDAYAAAFRKLLTLEQFRNEEMQKLYQQYLVAGPVGYVKDLFEHMGIRNAKETAALFYATLFLFYSLYDGAEDKSICKQQLEQTLLALEKTIGSAGDTAKGKETEA